MYLCGTKERPERRRARYRDGPRSLPGARPAPSPARGPGPVALTSCMARVRWSELIWSRSCGERRRGKRGPRRRPPPPPPRPRAHRGLLGEHLLHHHVHEPLPLLVVPPLLLQDRLHLTPAPRTASTTTGRPRRSPCVFAGRFRTRPRPARKFRCSARCPGAAGRRRLRPGRAPSATAAARPRPAPPRAGPCPRAVSESGAVSERGASWH